MANVPVSSASMGTSSDDTKLDREVHPVPAVPSEMSKTRHLPISEDSSVVSTAGQGRGLDTVSSPVSSSFVGRGLLVQPIVPPREFKYVFNRETTSKCHGVDC